MSIDLHVSTNWHVCWSDELTALVHVLVLSALKEFTWDDARVLLSWLIDGDAIVSQVERDDEASVDVLWYSSVESGGEPQDVLVVVNSLEEIDLWLLWYKSVHLTESVNFISESVVWRWLDLSLLWDLWHLNVSEWEIVSILYSVPSLSVLINTLNNVDLAIGVNVADWGNLVSGQVVVSNEALAWLVHIETVWQLLSSQEEREGITSIVGMVHFTDLDGIISQVVVDNVWEIVTDGEEAEDLTVMVKELLL